MAIGAFFCGAGWYRPSIRPAGPVKMTSGILLEPRSLRPEARAAMTAALEVTGNPSSVHAAGRAARRLVEAAREQVAALVGASAREVVFTSGGTEANMLALDPAIADSLFVSTIEHPSVRSGGRFAAAEDVPASAAGVVDLAALERSVAGRSRLLVSVMLANNETGVIQPIGQ